MLELGFLGEEMNLLITQGTDFGPVTVTTTNPDDSPVDFTGCSIRGQVRSSFGKHLGNVVVDMPNPETGTYSFSIPASTKLSAGLDLDSPDSNHTWDLELVESSGAIKPLYYGSVQVRKKVTKV